MKEIRYAPSTSRLAGIFAVFVVPLAAFAAFSSSPIGLFEVVLVLGFGAAVIKSGRSHTVILGPDYFIAGDGQRIQFSEIRPGGSIRGFIGDVYASESRVFGVSSVFLSQSQRSEIARRVAPFQRTSSDASFDG